MTGARKSAIHWRASAAVLAITSVTGLANIATAQTLLPPEGLGLVPSPTTPTYSNNHGHLAPPAVDLNTTQPATGGSNVGPWTTSPGVVPSVDGEPSQPGTIVYGDPIYLDLNGNVIPNPETTQTPIAPPKQDWNLHGFAPLPATQSMTPALLGPQLGSPSVSTWQPVQPKSNSTFETSAAARPATRSAMRTPSAARVWRAMGRLR